MPKIEDAVKFMEQIAADDSHGYAQDNRNGSPDYDCSSLVGTALNKAGFKVSSASTTRNLHKQLTDCGFKEIGITDTRQRGDIFLTPGKHVVMCTDDNNIVHASINEKNIATKGQQGDQTGKEICVRSFYNPSYKWTYHLRYDDTTFPPTINTVVTKGIDVSGYNIVSDYQAVKNAGVQFAILKIIRKDLNMDKLFETHLNGFTKVGIPVIGVYNYSYATTVEKSKSDAEIVVKYLKQYKLPTSTVVYMDVEDKCQQGLGCLLIDMINTYQTVIENAGYKFGLYTGLSFWNSNIKPYETKLKCNNEWIARYKKGYTVMPFAENPSESSKPNIGREIEGYQYTSSGKVNGINGNVDLDILYKINSVPVVPNNHPTSPTNLAHFSNYVATQSSNLNVRARSGNEFIKTSKSLKKGTLIKAYDAYDGWIRIDEKENKWCSANYISSNFVGTISGCSALNFRDSDSTVGTKLCSKPVNTKVKLFAQSTNTNWVLTEYGWCNPKYLKITSNSN